MAITALPTPPATTDLANFDARADAFVAALPTFVTEANQLAVDVDAAKDVAVNAAGAVVWVSGSFSEGDVVWSPTDYQTYRKVGGSGGTTDPALDFTNWAKISSGGAARIFSAASDTSPLAWNSDLYDTTILTAQAEALTISADAGIAQYDGKKHVFRFKDDGSARALTWTTGSSKAFRAIALTLPTTTVISKELYVGCMYNAGAARWDVVAVAREV
jgi:hypothetical protein